MTNQTRKSKTVQIVILLMTAICMLAAMLILAACDKNGVTSEQNPPIVETIETDYSMNYLFQGKDATEVNFKYKPKYSGRYVFTAAENSLLPTLNGVRIEQGQVDYYDQNKEYLFNFKVTNPTYYNVVAVDMKPEVVGASARIEVKRNNKYLMVSRIAEPALYMFEIVGCDFKIYDSSYKQIESVGGDAYFLGSSELEYVFIVLDRFLYYEDITVDFEISKKVLEKITVDKSQPFEPMQISGKAGEVIYLELDLQVIGQTVYHIVFSGRGHKSINAELFENVYFKRQGTSNVEINDDKTKFNFINISNGKFYLRLSFIEVFEGEIYIF